MIPVYAAKQLSDSRLEIHVTARAAPAPRRAKIRHGSVAKRTAHTVRNGRRLLMRREELAEGVLRRRDGRFDTAIGGAPLAQMLLADGVVLNGREMHDRITLAANIAQHQGTASRMSVSVRWPSSNSSV